MISILLADDHSIVRAGLRRLIEESGEMQVVAEAANGKEAMSLIRELKPDVAVVDISMPKLDGLEVVSQVKSSELPVPVLILTMHNDDHYAVRAIQVGAMGFLTKESAPERLVEAIRRVHKGRRVLTEGAAEALAMRVALGDDDLSPVEKLSLRELQVLRRLALGHTNREIAEAYNISVKTVDTYRLRLLKKLVLRNNAELSRFATRHRLII